MVRQCTECGIEGGLLAVRNRVLPLSRSRLLCKSCYIDINSKEQKEKNQINHIF